ncbi:MAG: hypothetical protein ACR2M1_05675 [Gemmatimonadaceae bacterium]
METIQVFVQGEGVRDIRLVEVPAGASVRDVVVVAAAHGFPAAADPAAVLFVEDSDDVLAPDLTIEAVGVRHHGSMHVHRCTTVATTVHFNSESKVRNFGPATTVARVKDWAVSTHAFNLTPVDAAEHVLQVTGTQDRPDEDVHIGTLVHASHCVLAFDLVAKVRVEG